MLITDHFRLSEFHQPARHGVNAARYPTEWVADRLYPLCRRLEAIRTALGGLPVTVISGYRTPEYNRLLPGAAKNSQHMLGRAADIIVEGKSAKEIWEAARQLHESGVYRIPGLGLYDGFVHIDVREGQVARWSGKRSVAQTA